METLTQLKPKMSTYSQALNLYKMLDLLDEPGFELGETRRFYMVTHIEARLTILIHKSIFTVTNPQYIKTMVDLYLRAHGTTWKKCIGYKNRVFSKPSRPEKNDSLLYHFLAAGALVCDESFWIHVRKKVNLFLKNQYSYDRQERIAMRNRLTAYKFILDELELPSIYGVLDE